MKGLTNAANNLCLNCGKTVTGKYCPNCGQKFQPTKVPLRVFLEDAAETLFNIDNRIFKTLKDLFLAPGKATHEYLAGKRARYLPPFRIYLTSSLVYFLIISLVDSSEILMASVNLDESNRYFAEFVQYSMIFLVPAFAWTLQLIYRKQKRYYVEFLIFSMHLHVPWFFFFGVSAIMDHYSQSTPATSSIELILINSVAILSKILVFYYLFASLKNVFEENWIKTFFKSFLVIFGYAVILALLLLGYTLILIFT